VPPVEDEVGLPWTLLLRTGFGNVFPHGRWDHGSTVLIADAVNSGLWEPVEEYARDVDWDPLGVS
jgi:hypothetical protein